MDAPLAKTTRPTFDDIYMELALSLARRSHCIRKKVGAVLTKESRIISVGYNGPPANTHHCDIEYGGTGCALDRKGSCSLSIHAEENAILYAAKNGASMDGGTIYVTLAPCLACARIIFTMGIKKVIYAHSYAEFKQMAFEEGVQFLERYGVEVVQYGLNPDSQD